MYPDLNVGFLDVEEYSVLASASSATVEWESPLSVKEQVEGVGGNEVRGKGEKGEREHRDG